MHLTITKSPLNKTVLVGQNKQLILNEKPKVVLSMLKYTIMKPKIQKNTEAQIQKKNKDTTKQTNNLSIC